jgi:tetratricopeptide (TPR) repeat protein
VRPGEVRAGQVRPGQRYSMLEIIQAYGQERLAQAGETDQLRAAHAAYFLRLADDGQEHLRGPRQLDWLQRFSEDQENLHAALRAAITSARSGDSSSADTAIALTGSLGWYWWLRSRKAEGADLSAEALSLAGEATDPERLAIAYSMGGMLAFDTHLFGEAPLWLRKAAELADQVQEPRSPVLRLARPLSLLFAEPLGIANQPEAFDDAVSDPDPWLSAVARIIRAQVAINAGRELDQAEADFRAAAATFEVTGERWIGAESRGGLALLESQRGDFTAAIAHYEQAIALAAEIGTAEDEGYFRVNMARTLWASGQRDQAEAELDRALRDAERIGWPEAVAYVLYTAGDLVRLGGQPDKAAGYLARAAELAVLPGMAPQLAAAVTSARGLLAAREGDLVSARRLHDQAWELVVPTADSPVIAQVLTGLADLALREGDHERAAELLARSVTVRGTTDRSDIDAVRLHAALEGAYGERPEHSGEDGGV